MIDIHRFHTLYNRPFFTGTQQSSQNQGNFYKYIYIYMYDLQGGWSHMEKTKAWALPFWGQFLRRFGIPGCEFHVAKSDYKIWPWGVENAARFDRNEWKIWQGWFDFETPKIILGSGISAACCVNHVTFGSWSSGLRFLSSCDDDGAASTRKGCSEGVDVEREGGGAASTRKGCWKEMVMVLF